MARQATKACGNRYFEARMRAAKWNEKLSTRAGAIDYLPGVTEDSLKKYELDITTAPQPTPIVPHSHSKCNRRI